MLQSVVDIRGNLPEGGSAAVQTNLGALIASFIGALILVGGIATLVYMMIGAVQWITAGGDKGKIDKARDKITQSVVGLGVLAGTFALFAVIQYFFGISVVSLGGGGGSFFGSGTVTSQPSSGGASGVNCTVGQVYNDGGAGGYCNGGVARVKCTAAGSGPSALPYTHYEPCDCVSGSRNPQYRFTSC